MIDDPIVAEARDVREKLAASWDYDVHAIFCDIRSREVALGDRLKRQINERNSEHCDANINQDGISHEAR